MKRKYEALLILHPKGKSSDLETLVSSIATIFEKEGATLTQVDHLGMKDFAYTSRHVNRGYYVNYRFEAEPKTLNDVRAKLDFDENVHLQHYSRVA